VILWPGWLPHKTYIVKELVRWDGLLFIVSFVEGKILAILNPEEPTIVATLAK
jgi:hypothetical protein